MKNEEMPVMFHGMTMVPVVRVGRRDAVAVMRNWCLCYWRDTQSYWFKFSAGEFDLHRIVKPFQGICRFVVDKGISARTHPSIRCPELIVSDTKRGDLQFLKRQLCASVNCWADPK
jgi:hypothetical protein